MSSYDETGSNFNLTRIKFWVRSFGLSIVWPITHYRAVPMWVSKNRYRILALFFVVLLLVFFNLIPDWLTPDKASEYRKLIYGLEGEAIFTLTVFAIFKNTIQRWLSNKLKISPKFNVYEYLSKISSSYREVRILETFAENLLEYHGDEFETALKKFVLNCKERNYEKLVIKILFIDPYCEAAEKRIMELYVHYMEDPRFSECKDKAAYVECFQKLMHGWLRQMENIMRNVSVYAQAKKVNLKFEVKIFDTRPPYSLYFCDNYASFGYHKRSLPSTESDQLIFLDTKSEAAKFQLDPFDKIWDTVTMPVGHFIEMPFKNKDLIRRFKELRKLQGTDEISAALIKMSRESIVEKHNFVDLIQDLEDNHRKIFPEAHFNIFGTGGDKFKTINISTMASILASHYHDDEIRSLPIKKVGTLAVTCNVGSQNFYDSLQAESLKRKPLEYSRLLDYNMANESMYLPIMFFGYIYYDIIRVARRQIYEQKELDIFKIIFPLANLSGYKGIVNGVSVWKDIQYYEYIYKNFKKTGIIVHNRTYGVDELFAGENEVIYYRKGEQVYKEEIKIIIPDNHLDSYLKFFLESKPQEHVDKYIRLIESKAPAAAIDTISYNIALLLKLHYLCAESYSFDAFLRKDLYSLKEKAKAFFFKDQQHNLFQSVVPEAGSYK